ncbi:hypothetical protein [Arenibaculum pallidiluteum]|uniref:hypothetical protein n=1 Tax=Arenibaculum pallidiluteum TaxID=2812559 RepID=UPI001A966263|nr:hypothetical protein [Arenibaculum pallidiluteum]
MHLDPKRREELAMRRYQASDRAGVEWHRRPEWVRQAFRDAVEREHEAVAPSAFDPSAAGLVPR